MSVERIHQMRPCPNFKLHELPEAEREEAGAIRLNIDALHRRATSFWAGRLLYEDCAHRQVFDYANRGTYHQWQLCAARDCVMSIYHFGRIIEGIDESIGVCVSLRDLIDNDAKRAARKRFERKFPFYISLRHAIAHSAERSKTASATKRHGKAKHRTIEVNPLISIGAGKGNVLLHDNLWGTTFTSMWDGNIVRCEIDEQSGIWLDEITDAYWAAFDKFIDPNSEPLPTVTVSPHPPPRP